MDNQAYFSYYLAWEMDVIHSTCDSILNDTGDLDEDHEG